MFHINDSKESGFTGHLGMSVDEMRKNWSLYSCWCQVGRKPAMLVKVSNKLIKKKKYRMTKQQVEELDEYQLMTYYRKVKQEKVEEETGVVSIPKTKKLVILLEDDDF